MRVCADVCGCADICVWVYVWHIHIVDTQPVDSYVCNIFSLVQKRAVFLPDCQTNRRMSPPSPSHYHAVYPSLCVCALCAG